MTLSRPLLTLSQPLKHSQGLCSLQALNWLVIGNSQVLSHGCESVAEAKKVPVEVVREPVGKTVLKNSGTNQNVLVLFQNF